MLGPPSWWKFRVYSHYGCRIFRFEQWLLQFSDFTASRYDNNAAQALKGKPTRQLGQTRLVISCQILHPWRYCRIGFVRARFHLFWIHSGETAVRRPTTCIDWGLSMKDIFPSVYGLLLGEIIKGSWTTKFLFANVVFAFCEKADGLWGRRNIGRR